MIYTVSNIITTSKLQLAEDVVWLSQKPLTILSPPRVITPLVSRTALSILLLLMFLTIAAI